MVDEPSDADLALAERLYLLLDHAYAAASAPEDEDGWRRLEEAVATEISDLDDAHAIITLLVARDANDLLQSGASPSVLWAAFYAQWGHRLKGS